MMKKLLLAIPLILGPALTLHMCGGPKVPVELPSAASVIEGAHEAFPIPKLPEVPFIVPRVPAAKRVAPKPKQRPHQVKRKEPHVVILAPKDEERLPQELGCIFPFSLIPGCHPQVGTDGYGEG
jgi:hypothetical protein